MIPTANLPLIMNAAYKNYQRGLTGGDLAPSTDANGILITHCNQFIQAICAEMGYDAMNGMLANEMFDFMLAPANGWIAVDYDVAQQHANAGVLVILAYKNPVPGHHGHVTLVLPGICEPSQSFMGPVPKIASIGRLVSFGLPIDATFLPTEAIQCFALAGMIG